MAEEQLGQERSEQPTSKRLEEARKKGQVARVARIKYVSCCCWKYGIYLADGRSVDRFDTHLYRTIAKSSG